MKKMLFMFICFALCVSTAFAATLTMPTQPPMEWPPATSTPGTERESINLKGMTYSELVALKDKINLAIWSSRQWQEVTVPQGVWKVGEDIPAGHWTIICADPWRKVEVSWGESLSDSGESISWFGRCSVYNYIYNENHKYYEKGDGVTNYSFEVKKGDYIIIDEGEAIFMPYSGKPSLGFK